MIHYREINMFDCVADCYLHQVNCQGVMGSGVAKQVKMIFPEVFRDYQNICKEQLPTQLLGKAQIIQTSLRNRIVYVGNLFAQTRYGYDSFKYTDYDALKECFKQVEVLLPSDKKIALPYKIGCDRGGGDWNIVKKIIADTFKTHEVYICKLPEGEISNRDIIINWIQDYFKWNGPTSKAIVGISGGKDSTIVAALCVEALGKDRVIGIYMPNGQDGDIEDARRVCNILGIQSFYFNISKLTKEIYTTLEEQSHLCVNSVVRTNTPSRLRMAILYAYSASLGGRVANTGNRSEAYIGYTTKYGDRAGDFAPLADLTVKEVCQLGDSLDLPYDLVHKVPSDGMCGLTDEENFGFSYKDLDDFLEGKIIPVNIRRKIEMMHMNSRHKRECIQIPHPEINKI